MLQCKEFVNADEIAKGLSPFQPEKVAIEAGRIMLKRMQELLAAGYDFAFETTLASKSYANTIKQAQLNSYYVTLIYFWLNSPELAIERVKERVQNGGHNIPEEHKIIQL
jgi:predicted ABC-type ATPase